MGKIILLAIAILGVSIIATWNAFDISRQDQEIEELKGQIGNYIITDCSDGFEAEPCIRIKGYKYIKFEPLTQEPKECFDLVSEMIKCPEMNPLSE